MTFDGASLQRTTYVNKHDLMWRRHADSRRDELKSNYPQILYPVYTMKLVRRAGSTSARRALVEPARRASFIVETGYYGQGPLIQWARAQGPDGPGGRATNVYNTCIIYGGIINNTVQVLMVW